MGIRLKKLAETWENRRAVGYSGGNMNFGLVLRDILAKRDWKFHDISQSIDSCFANLSIGNGCLFVIDDHQDNPSALILRHQFFDQVACLCPTLIICSEQDDNEVTALRRMGAPILVKKPLTPKNFIDAFDSLIERWSTGYLVELRRVFSKFVAGHSSGAVTILQEIVAMQQPTPVAATALSLHYRRAHDLEKAESILQAEIKKGCFDLNIVLPLVDLYLSSACPAKALSLLHKANEVYNRPAFLTIDAIQANLLLNRIKDCVPYLESMIEKDFFPEVARHYLPRMVYSSGMLAEFDKSIKFRAERFDEYQRAWHLLSDEDAMRRREQYEKVAQIKKAQAKENRARTDTAHGHESTAAKLDHSPDETVYTPIGKPIFK